MGFFEELRRRYVLRAAAFYAASACAGAMIEILAQGDVAKANALMTRLPANVDEAIALLHQLLEIPTGFIVSQSLIRLDPAWQPSRNDPRFQRLIAESTK